MQKRVACITGASSGIGRTSAVALAKTGQWRIVLSGRREQELEKTAQMCRDAAGPTNDNEDLTLIVAGDVSEESNVESLFDAIRKTYGKAITAHPRIDRHQCSTPCHYRCPLFHRPSGYALQRQSTNTS
jgi:NAD(P)-dependent dehydrogenase (short-subunit alcohol dehydrogenase family)